MLETLHIDLDAEYVDDWRDELRDYRVEFLRGDQYLMTVEFPTSFSDVRRVLEADNVRGWTKATVWGKRHDPTTMYDRPCAVLSRMDRPFRVDCRYQNGWGCR